MITLPVAQPIDIVGPAGRLEGILEEPPATSAVTADGTRFAVVCHPHPLHGGTMTNKVVHTLARTFVQQGVPALRFNFRGVGRSEGLHDDARGEVDDALAAVAWARTRWPQARPWFAGFSFGGYVAARAAAQCEPEWLVTVAPAVTRFDVSDFRVPACPWLLVQGDADELVDAGEVMRWAAALSPPPTVVLVPGCGHFFHGRLHDLRDLVLAHAPAR